MSGILALGFLFFFNDTFRRERSLTYQSVLKQRLRIAGMRSSSVESNSMRIENADLEKRNPPAPVLPDIELSLRDVSPFKPIIIILRRWNNVAVLIATGKSSLNAPGHFCPSTFKYPHRYDVWVQQPRTLRIGADTRLQVSL